MFIIINRIRRDFFSFVPAKHLSIYSFLIPSSSVTLSYFILAVPVFECLGKHSCSYKSVFRASVTRAVANFL